MTEAMTPEPLYDVVIYERSTRHVYSVVGTNLRRYGGCYNAEKRRETALTWINARYAVAIFAAGRYGKGDVLPQEAHA
jgi:hypothetical protein